jgi:hypothetical protein
MRFYVQDPHIDGLAVIDRETGSMIISSFGDTGEWARSTLQILANSLNAAVDPDYDRPRTDAFKDVCHTPLAWRCIEHLSLLILSPPKASEGDSEDYVADRLK